MMSRFKVAMAKLAVLGHDTRTLVDCSEVIPQPATAKTTTALLPAGKTLADVQGAVRSADVTLARFFRLHT